MSSIDNRVVQMEFENREFEKGVAESQKTLDDLDKKLNDVGKDGGEGIQSSLEQVNTSIDETSSKFSAFEEIARGIFIRLGSQIADFGLDLASSLSIDQIAEGYSKYENVVKNVAGLVNSAAYQTDEEGNPYNYDDVMKALDKLSWYSDVTSYSLEAMESSLLTFMNSDIDMNTATDMLMGIGNAFSYAGATATEMDGAFAMLSKAMGSYMTLMQWNSLERVYKVITPQLKDQMLEAALAVGTLEKTEEGLYKTTEKAMSTTGDSVTFAEDEFRTSLKAGWMTADVMQTVYSNYGAYATKVYDLYSKVTEADGYIDVYTAMEQVNEEFEKTKDTLTDTDIALWEFQKRAFESAQEAKVWSEVVDAIKDAVSTQWMNIFSAIIGDYYEAVDLFGTISDWLTEKFVTPIAKAAEMAQQWKDLGGRSELLTALGNIITSFDNFSAAVKNALKSLIPKVTVEKIYDLTVKFRELTEKLFITEDIADKLAGPFKVIVGLWKTMFTVISASFKIVKALYTAFKPIVVEVANIYFWLTNGIAKILEFVNSLGILDNMATQVTYKFTDVKKKIQAWYDSFTNGRTIIEAVVEELSGIKFSLDDVKISFDSLKENLTEFWNYIYDMYVVKLETMLNQVVNEITTFVGKIIGAIAYGITWIKDNFSSLYETIKNIWAKITSTIENAVTKFTNFFKGLFGSLNEVVGESGSKFSQYMSNLYSGETRLDQIMRVIREFLSLISDIFGIEIVKGIANLFKGFKKIPKIINSMIKPLDALTKSLKTLTKSVRANIIKKIALSVLILAAAMAVLAVIPADKIDETFGLMIIMLGLIAGMVAVVSHTSDNFSKAAGTIVAMGAAVLLIAVAMAKLAEVAGNENFGTAFVALIVMLGALLVVIGILKDASSDQGLLSKSSDIGLMLLKLASGLLIISQAIKNLAEIDAGQLGWACAAIIVIIIALTGFIWAMGQIDGNNIGNTAIKAGGALVLIAVGILLLTASISIFANMEWQELAGGLVAVGAILIALAFMSQQVQNNQHQLLALSTSLLIIATAMIGLAAGIYLIGKLDAQSLIVSTSILFIVLALLTSISKTVMAKNVLALSASVGILGISLIAFAAGLTALGAIPLLLLAKGLVAFAVIFVFLVAMAPSLEVAGAGFIKFSAGALLLGLALIAIATGITMLSVALLLIDGDVIAEKVTELIAGLAAAIVASVEVVVEAIFAFIAGIIAGLGKGIGMILSAIGVALDSIVKGMCDMIGIEYPGTIGEAILSLINWLGNKFTTEWGPAIWAWIKEYGGKLLNWIWEGIKSAGSKLLELLKNIFTNIKNAVLGRLEETRADMTNSGKNIIQGLKNGITSAITNSGIYKTITELGNKIKSVFNKSVEINSPSKAFAEAGSYIVQGLANGITDNTSLATDASSALGTSTIDSLKEAISNQVVDGVESDLTITPVLDLSQIEAGTADMQDMLNMDSLTAKVGSMGTIQTSSMSTASQLADLKSNLSTVSSNGTTSSDSIANYIKEALNGVGIYADSKKIGKLVTVYQANTSRAGGY